MSDFLIAEKKPLTDIGCGVVVPFTPRTETVTVLIPKGLATVEQVETLIVRGPSLGDYGINDGDVLAFRTNATNKDVKPDTICVVHILSTGELQAKKVVRQEDGTGKVALRSSGGGISDKYYDAEDIEILGIVFAAQKLTDRFGRFMRPNEDVPW